MMNNKGEFDQKYNIDPLKLSQLNISFVPQVPSIYAFA